MAPADELQRERTGATPTSRFVRRFPLAAPKPARKSGVITEGTAGIATSVREGLYRRALAAADAVALAATLLVVLPLIAGSPPMWLVLTALPLIVGLNKILGAYERDELVLNKSTLDEAPKLMQVAAMSSLLLWLALDAWSAVELDSSDVLVVWASMFALLLALRATARMLARRAASTERVLVIGEGASIAAVEEKLASGRVNARVVAALPLEHRARASSHELGTAFSGLVRRHDVDRAIIAPSAGGSAETVDLIRIAKHAGVRVSVLPRMLEVVGSAVEFDHLDGLTMLGVRRFGLARSSRILKRTFDLGGSSLLLLGAAPVMLAIAVAIKLDSRGPVFFRQTRVGKDGEHFKMLKFRSMVEGAEARKGALRHLNETEGLFKIENDPRITRVGRLLRRTSLDELPQLINVWRGEMSLVGPRPLVVDEDAQVQGFDRHRLHLTPGMTGHWQILGSTRVPLHEMVGIDYLYVANWSLWNDVKILLRTVPHMIAHRGV